MSVKELYESFGGDYNRAVQTMMNDAFISRMLTKFIEKNSYDDIILSYQNKDMKGIFEASHSLKGVCGNLSLTPLYEKSSVLCDKVRNLNEGETVNVDAEVNELKESYEKILTLIKTFLNK